MKRDIRFAEKLLLIGYGLILLFMIIQDWVPLGPLNDVEAIKSVHSVQGVMTGTLINTGQILILICILLIFIGKKYPNWIKIWLFIHPTCIFLGALFSWWIPYFTGFGAAEKVESYRLMFANTHAFLPVMNGIVPNTIHTIFHIILLTCIVLTVYLFLTSKRKSGNYSFAKN